jgi:glucose-6-phosphate 1-dehydrogenase
MMGDATLFQRADMVEAGWAASQPLLDEWAAGHTKVQWYEAGSHGPETADRLLDRDGRHWLPLP